MRPQDAWCADRDLQSWDLAKKAAMKRRITGIVEDIVSERPGAQEITVRVEQENEADATCLRTAINLIELTGRITAGERVILNTVAVELGLGTGGKDFVISVLRDQEPTVPTPGHILKLRYTPLQTPVLAVESPESPHHDALCHFHSLNGLPVVCAQLHSQIPAIVAGMRWVSQRHSEHAMPRIAYIMTDSGALPLALSQLAAQSAGAGLALRYHHSGAGVRRRLRVRKYLFGTGDGQRCCQSGPCHYMPGTRQCRNRNAAGLFRH